jgi:hypothetical protein
VSFNGTKAWINTLWRSNRATVKQPSSMRRRKTGYVHVLYKMQNELNVILKCTSGRTEHALHSSGLSVELSPVCGMPRCQGILVECSNTTMSGPVLLIMHMPGLASTMQCVPRRPCYTTYVPATTHLASFRSTWRYLR